MFRENQMPNPGDNVTKLDIIQKWWVKQESAYRDSVDDLETMATDAF